MERIRLTEENIEECVARAAEILRAGGMVLYPTDTLYGLGVDALSDTAVAKLYALKGRDALKPTHAIVSDFEMMSRYAQMDVRVQQLASRFLPGPLTLILNKKEEVHTGIANNRETIGFRIPKHSFCAALTKAFDGPVTTTSANPSGEAPYSSVEAILERLGIEIVDLVIDAGPLPASLPSSVVDISGVEPVVLREGAISRGEIAAVLGSLGGV